MKNKKLQFIKWIWLILVFGGGLFYLSKNFTTIVVFIKEISVTSIIFSILFLILGKLLLTISSKWAIEGQEWRPSFFQIFHINSITQLAKYLPGGVWHFVGKFGLYQTNGLTTIQSSSTILVENLWLILSAFCFGIIASFSGNSKILLSRIGISDLPISEGMILLIIFIIWVLGLFAIEYFVKSRRKIDLWHLIRLVLLQTAIWFFIGLSFWVLTPLKWNYDFLTLVIGSFALSWAIGFITVFAPGGLGIREVTITALLASQIAPEEAVLFAAVNRLIWVITELGLGAFSEIMSGSSILNATFKPTPPQDD